MIEEPGGTNHTPPVLPSSYLHIDDELTVEEAKQVKDDDQATQIILMGLLKDIYATTESCNTINEIWKLDWVQCMAECRDSEWAEYRESDWQAFTSSTHVDNAPVYDSDGSTKYTELLESTTDTYLVQQYDSNVIPMDSSMDLSGGQVEQHPDTIEETHAFYESLYNNLVIEVEKVNTTNRETREANVKLTTKLARYKGQEKHFEFNQEQFEELENGYKKSVYQE
ncbi:hypothetical protein Tco_0975196 [Tanacetum coccineum]|uniref:Uncharacterized protein n=1 Tax=Tanacetum coccineum TaxID=301880 RepID=A0ABQ5EDQ2_9ASTR